MITLSLLPLAIWLLLLFGRGMFWLARDRDDCNEPAEPKTWPLRHPQSFPRATKPM